MTAQTIRHYRVVRRLGTGGMGEVFLAEDTRLERSVALKIMSVELAGDPNQVKRFRSEARAASGLAHPNICVIHEVGETEDGRPFLAMEYVEGQTLDVLMQQRRLRIREIISLGIEVAEALEAAHARRIVHRDIKPSNIMLDARGRAKVLDFGLAKRFAEDTLSAASTSAAQTQSGMLIGTPHYMSPEQALGQDLDHRTDIFSLGVVLYELVAGQRPFLGRTVGETINNVVNQIPAPLGLENSLFSPALDEIIFKCLEKDPGRRYSSAKPLHEALARLKIEAERATAATAAKENAARNAAPPAAAKADPAITTPTSAPPQRRVGRPVAFIGVATAVLLGVAVWLVSRNGPPPAAADAKVSPAKKEHPSSVAVLPFDNFSSEAQTDYLSDGFTEEITTALSRIPGLKVAARNSAFTFKGRKEDARKVGEALHVSTLLEGSIRKVGRQLRVTAQLINVADGFHLWSETYDRSVDDIIGVQDDIARRIAQRLQGETGTAYVPSKKVDSDAHQLYMQARLFWNKRTESALKKAVQIFQQAIAKDPDYAEAHAGLAATYLVLPDYSLEKRSGENRLLSRASANRALELDPSCAEAHAVLANLQSQARDFKGAEEHFRRAIQLDANYATAHHWYGRYLNLHGHRDQGLAELKTAADLDPLSPVIHTSVAEWYFLGGDFDRAIVESRKLIDAFPDFPHARGLLISAQVKKGLFKEALLEIDKARALQPDEPLALLDMRGYALGRSGEKAEAQKILSLLEAQRGQGRQVDGPIGFVYLGLRDFDKAIDAFEKVAETEGIDDGILCDPFFDEVRNLPRVQALLKKAGIEQ